MNPQGFALFAEDTSPEEEWDRAATPLNRVSHSHLFPDPLRASSLLSLFTLLQEGHCYLLTSCGLAY